MIIENGTIQPKIKNGGGLANGNPVRSSETWGNPIPCNVRVNKNANNGRTAEGNTFTVASYEVLIDSQPFDATSVKITQEGKDVGEFSVLSTELLDAVGAIKITV